MKSRTNHTKKHTKHRYCRYNFQKVIRLNEWYDIKIVEAYASIRDSEDEEEQCLYEAETKVETCC